MLKNPYTKVDFETISCMVWCSGYTGLILAGAFLVFLIVGFHMQIAVYIGVQRLVQQLLIVLAILGVLLISYFISTWVLFNKSASA